MYMYNEKLTSIIQVVFIWVTLRDYIFILQTIRNVIF